MVFILLLTGYPVAFTLGGASVLIGAAVFGTDFFNLLPLRVWGIMENYLLIAVPLFVFMGMMLEKSGIASELLETMGLLFGRLRGGLAISVVVVGALLAASTGIVGATVVTMGLLSLPTMLRRGYDPRLASATIAASGTLGQIIPPSIVLVLLGSVMNVPVGDMFMGALLPGILLVWLYLMWIVIIALFRGDRVPAMPAGELAAFRAGGTLKRIFSALVLPLLLIIAVLGSIFAGVASPTEAAGIGALGATLLTVLRGKFNLENLGAVTRETTFLTALVFMILVGATAFGLVFRGMDGDRLLIDLIEASNLSPMGFLMLVMGVIFVAGFFIDFIEITFIIVPIVMPIFTRMGVDPLWLGILLALNLQTSFLTPPFGFALFYLKGVAPPEIKTTHIYRGIVPFIIIQIITLILVVLYPEIATWLPVAIRN
ncbi:MAG: TRAP transporter large permease subunit [Calditrichaeota bacterium]|nr:TRAP transporter large permease subunit [Calditrichota bacterium]